MIVGPLKKGLRTALPVISVFFVLFLLPSLFSVSALQSVDSRHVIYSAIQSSVHSQVLIFIINILCIAVGSLLISVFAVRHEIVDKQNYLPAFLYLFFSSFLLDKNLLHPSVFANIFILLALNELMNTYREEEVLSKIFNAAFYTCIAFFFYINYAFFVLLFFVTLSILRPFNWREWVISLMGFVAVLFIYSCLGFLANIDFTSFYGDIIELIIFFQKPSLSEYFYPVAGIIFLLILLGASKHFQNGFGGTVKTQKVITVIYWFLLLSFINFFSKNNQPYFPLVASIIPLSILMSDYFFNIKQIKVSNTLFFLLLASGTLLFLRLFMIF